MTDVPDNTREVWPRPGKGEFGVVPWVDRVAVAIVFRGAAKGMWIARPSVPKEKELIDILQETCAEMGLKKIPKLTIVESKIPNAYSSLLSLGGSLGFTTNLIDIMPHEQVKAVMAHELTHYSHRTRDRITIIGIGYGVDFASNLLLGHTVLGEHHISSLGDIDITSREYNIAEIVAAYNIQKAANRPRETEADMGGADVVGPKIMADSLRTLSKRSKELKSEMSTAEKIRHKRFPIYAHPKTSTRIERLEERADMPDGSDTPSR